MTVIEVANKINQDSELMANLKTKKTPEEVYEFTKTLGLDASMTFEEFKNEVDRINDSVSKINDADLDAVSGGDDTKTTLTALSVVTTSAMVALAI